jgi:outer membrane biosynthesis protein TonB
LKQPIILRIFKGSQLVEIKQFESDQVIFGHDAEVQVDLKDASVSNIHCLIELRDSGYYICDLGSASGTLKNGKSILDEPINSGDSIEIGPFRIQFFVGVPKPKAPPQMTVAPTGPAAPVAPVAVLPTAAPAAVILSPIEKSVETRVAMAPESSKLPPAPPKLPDSARIVKGSGSSSKSGKKKKGEKTFAPNSDISDLRTHLKSSKGPVVEVLVAWKERILQSYHFSTKQMVTIGSSPDATIVVPSVYLRGTVPFIDLKTDVRIFAAGEMEVENVSSTGEIINNDDLLRLGRASRSAQGTSLRLEQGEMIVCKMGGGDLLVFVRFVPATARPILAAPFDLTAGELTGLVVSFVIVALMALYFSVYQPEQQVVEEKEEELRIAQFIYTPPSTQPTPEPPPPTQPPVLEPPVTVPPPTTQPKIVKVDLSKEQQVKGNVQSKATVSQQAANKASEVKPIPNKTNRPKKFTSTKQGGSVKVGETEGANAPTVDPTSVGLAGAFGGGGMRKKLDQAYSGTGDLLGMADKATGAAGQNTNRAGDDIGSKFKDTGAGGKGTATQGISGIGTKGRGGGMSTYGEGVGLGGKGNVSIEAGGMEEGWEGTIDREAVRRVIRSILGQIKNCYVRSLRTNEDLQGRVVIEFDIGEQGIVRRAGIKNNALADGNRVGDCIATLIRAQKFPEPPQGTVAQVAYPFNFEKQK